jgi:hypothetical protein
MVRIKITPTKLRWRTLKEQGVEGLNSCYNYLEYLKKEHGFEHLRLSGGVGKTGTKIHVLDVIGRWLDTEKGRVLEYAHVESYCGSMKWNTYTLEIYDDDITKVDCKKCLKREN